MIGVYAIIYLSSIVGGPTWRRGCSCSYIVGNLRTKFETSGGPEPTRDISATTSHHTDKTVAANLKVRSRHDNPVLLTRVANKRDGRM